MPETPSCSAAFYADKPTARDAQHKISRKFHFSTTIRFCEEHNAYHTIANVGRMKLPKRAVEVLKFLLQGFRQEEIAKFIGRPRHLIEWDIRALKLAFGAMSLPQLIGICIAVGAVSAKESLPGAIEGSNDNGGQNGERSGVAGERKTSCG